MGFSANFVLFLHANKGKKQERKAGCCISRLDSVQASNKITTIANQPSKPALLRCDQQSNAIAPRKTQSPKTPLLTNNSIYSL